MILFIKALLLLVSEPAVLSGNRDCAQLAQVNIANTSCSWHEDRCSFHGPVVVISHYSYGNSQMNKIVYKQIST